MSPLWKSLSALAVVLPVGGYVAGSLAATSGDDPAPREVIVIRDAPTQQSSPGTTISPRPSPSGDPSGRGDDSDPDDDHDDGDDDGDDDVRVVNPEPDDLDDGPDEGDEDDRDDGDDGDDGDDDREDDD